MNFAKVARVSPTCRNQEGGLLSNFHDSVEPSAAMVSTMMSMCGFTQSTLVSEPFQTNGFAMSNTAEGEWCAAAEAASERPASVRNAAASRDMGATSAAERILPSSRRQTALDRRCSGHVA